MMTKPHWFSGDDPGQASNIHLVVTIKKGETVIYDVVYWRHARHLDVYNWVDLDVNLNPIVGYIPLTDLVGWCTGSDDYPHLADSGNRTFLSWTYGESSDPDQRYIVSLASQYDVQQCIEGDWIFPTKKEANYGFDKYIPLDQFFANVARYFPFSG
ncbi:hypothetical protein [Microbulbifer variabilis]|uniref:hypothetical protein n=1 Tax=Microbulbifer variabilis TaxID=266805 RepID=UPI001CFE5AEA|nr:hypothetical protein [Microbulbifer variabilis]